MNGWREHAGGCTDRAMTELYIESDPSEANCEDLRRPLEDMDEETRGVLFGNKRREER